MVRVSMHPRILPVSLAVFISAFFGLVFAQDVSAAGEVQLNLDAATIFKGYTSETPDAAFRMGIWPNVLNVPALLTVNKLDDPGRAVPADAKVVSDFYEFDFVRQDGGTSPLVLPKPYTLAIKYSGDNLKRKVIKYYDDNKGQWLSMPSTTDFAGGYVRAITHLPYSRVAVFEENILQEGRASYYTHPKYRGQYIAANRDYVSGTTLRVESLENGKTVDVIVRDYGPDGAKHPDRVVDISREAFVALAPLSRGTIPVRVYPVAPRVLGAQTRQPSAPAVSARAAIAIDAATGNVLFEKNADATLPIASLSKIMTAYVFLKTNTPMDAVVTYAAQDDAIGSKLYVSPGETMRVRDLFFTALAGSANNATKALARSTGLSEQEFVRRMNDQAKAWGMQSTSFEEVTGLSEHNVSTARDYAILARRAFGSMQILQGTTVGSYTFSTINTDKPHTIVNKNKMLNSTWYLTGIKTGYTDEALYALVVKAKDRQSGREVITVLLGASTDALRYSESNALVSYAFASLGQ